MMTTKEWLESDGLTNILKEYRDREGRLVMSEIKKDWREDFVRGLTNGAIVEAHRSPINDALENLRDAYMRLDPDSESARLIGLAVMSLNEYKCGESMKRRV